jgi:hypothetical protein
MLTNQFKVEPDEHGGLVEKIAHQIRMIEPHAVIPNDIREARRMLANLEQRGGGTMESPQSRRASEASALYNDSLLLMQRARRLGVRPPDAKLVPPAWNITADELQVMRETIAELHADVDAFEQLNPDQRAAKQLAASTEARFAKVIEYVNKLAKRVEELEAEVKELRGTAAEQGAA